MNPGIRTYPAAEFAGRTSSAWEVPGIRFVETHYEAGQRLERHAHERAHFCLVLEGEYVEDADSREFLRVASSIHFQPAGLTHGERHRRHGAHFIVQIESHILHDAEVEQAFRTEMNGAAALTAVRMHALMKSRNIDDPVAPDLLWELLSFLRQARIGKTQWVERGRQAIHETYLHTVRLTDMARDAQVHPVHFAQTFRKVFGCTVGEYQRSLRIHHACRLLARTRYPISRIAVESGFTDESHMSRCFRRTMLMTPGAYRRSVS